MKKLLMVAVASLLVVGACTDTPVEPIDRDPVAAFGASEGMFDFGPWIVGACDEPVEVSGTFHPVSQVNVSNSGQINAKFHINAKGKGVGLFSGATYQWNDNLKTSWNGDTNDGAPFVFSDYGYLRLIGQGQLGDLNARYQFHITFDANGVLRSVVDNFEFECN